jgi:hypothetical protein
MASRRWASELRLATENHTPRLRSLASLAGPRPDKFPLELRQTAQYRQHESPVRRRRVRPSISDRSEAGAPFGNRAQQVEEIASRPRKTIEPSND